jgi:putative chitinase
LFSNHPMCGIELPSVLAGGRMNITASDIRAISPSATGRIVAGIVDNQDAIAKGGIDTPLRLSHFMAQLAHESAHLTVTREFASGAAYEGRRDLGNVHDGDGRRYRGRGLIQTTGRANYREATKDIQDMNPGAPNFEDDPEALEEFPWALLAGISYWRRRNINAVADRDEVEAVTRKINGGTNGLPERIRYLAKAKAIWMNGASATVSGADPVLRSGDSGAAVTKLQKALIEAGFTVSTDGAFGEHTKSAVIAFQTRHGLTPDGVVGPGTWTALGAS